LSAGLRERFRVLTGKSRSIIPRQQTLRALIDWSYELLDDRERTVFRGLSVFAGSFTVEDCESVCGGFGDSRADMLDVLTSLVDKSLVSAPLAEGSDDDGRYRLIETLREYAAEMLARSDETKVRYDRLTRWALDVVTAAHREWVTSGTDQWERRYKPELENVRSALEWSLERRNDVQAGVQIVARGRRMYGALAPAEGLRWTELALEQRTTNDDALRAELSVGHAQMNVALRRPVEALASAREAKGACAGVGLEESEREAQIVAGYALAALGRSTEAKTELLDVQDYVEGKALAQFCGIVASDLGVTYMNAGELDDARTSFERALRAFRVTSNSRGIRAVVTNLAEIHFQAGDVEAAIELIGSELARDERGDAVMFSNLSAYLIAAGRFAEALEYAREGMIGAEASRREVDMNIAFLHIAAASVLAHDAREELDMNGLRLFGFVESRFSALSYELEFTERREREAVLAAIRRRMNPLELEKITSEGQSLNDRTALEVAMAIHF
jgi:predicted ATPase